MCGFAGAEIKLEMGYGDAGLGFYRSVTFLWGLDCMNGETMK